MFISIVMAGPNYLKSSQRQSILNAEMQAYQRHTNKRFGSSSGYVNSLNSSDREAIMETRMQKYSKSSNSKVTKYTAGGVFIQNNSGDSFGRKKKCLIKVDSSLEHQRQKGASIQKIVYIDGGVINVCN